MSSDRDILPIRNLKKAIKDADTAIENLWQSLERGETSDLISERIREKQAEKEKYLAELEKEERKITILTEPQVLAFLDYIRKLPNNDVNKLRAIINNFVNAIYLYDDRFTVIFNSGSRMLEVKDIPLDDIETALAGCSGVLHTGSLGSELAPPPPQGRKPACSTEQTGFSYALLCYAVFGNAAVFSASDSPSAIPSKN